MLLIGIYITVEVCSIRTGCSFGHDRSGGGVSPPLSWCSGYLTVPAPLGPVPCPSRLSCHMLDHLFGLIHRHRRRRSRHRLFRRTPSIGTNVGTRRGWPPINSSGYRPPSVPRIQIGHRRAPPACTRPCCCLRRPSFIEKSRWPLYAFVSFGHAPMERTVGSGGDACVLSSSGWSSLEAWAGACRSPKLAVAHCLPGFDEVSRRNLVLSRGCHRSRSGRR